MNNFLEKILYNFYKYLQIKIKNYEHTNLKKKLKFCGKNVHLQENVEIEFPEKVSLESGVFIGNNVILRGRGGICIGKNTVIAFNTIILSANHDYKSGIPFGENYIEKPVSIGEGCWLGAGGIILPGVNIGEGVVVGAGAIITKDISPFSIVANNIEMKIIDYRFDSKGKKNNA